MTDVDELSALDDVRGRGLVQVAVAPSKFAKGFDGSGREVRDAYEVLDLRAALERTYTSDAHLVTYVVAGAERQPRINKPGLPYFPGRVEVGAFFCDVDNPGHAAWTDELLARARDEYSRTSVLATAGVYHTAHGRRIVQPLAAPIAVQEVEPYLRRWLGQLCAAGLEVDWKCRDWTRHFRLPHVFRAGRPYRSPLVDLTRMRPIGLEPMTTGRAGVVAMPEGTRRPRAMPVVDWAIEVPPTWHERVARLAAAVRDVSTEWHTLFMALAGALVGRGVPHEQVPATCRAISLATGADARTADREAAARSTVQRKLAGSRIAGHGVLARDWPSVARVFDDVMASGGEARLRAQAAAGGDDPPPPPLAESVAALEDALRQAPDGVTLISAECGLGKTQAAMRVAAERAAKAYASAGARGLRAPPQSKTAISVDKNALAIQVARDLVALGTPVRRLFGPLSLLDAQGRPVCQYHRVAAHLVEGGQSMQWELCRGRGIDPCEHYQTCAARDGADGDDAARVTVGPHALLGPLDAEAGLTGVLVIDEPPPLLETLKLDELDLAAADALLAVFDTAYGSAMAPALEATRLWVRDADDGTVAHLPYIVRTRTNQVSRETLEMARLVNGLDGADALECARAAQFPRDRPGTAPPLPFLEVRHARRSVERARRLGVASRVLKILHHVLTTPHRVMARVQRRPDGQVLLLTGLNEGLERALKRQGAVVVMDANAELHAPILNKALGYPPRFHRFGAADGAPIERTLIRCSTATRRGWFDGRQLALQPSLVSAVRHVIDWLLEDDLVRTVGLITMHTVELALRAAIDPRSTSGEIEWQRAQQRPEVLAAAREQLGPIVRRLDADLRLGHYGAVRGLNHMADVDALVTLGDPWPNLGDVENDVTFVGEPGARDERAEARCRAELEQAHGRLRAVHRTRAARALHVGQVMPSGTGWTSGEVTVRRLRAGRPAKLAILDQSELEALVDRLGGVRATAKMLGCDPSHLAKCIKGNRRLSDVHCELLRTAKIR